eukprot:scaffold39953_cov58-Attheya_sp.AAC.2
MKRLCLCDVFYGTIVFSHSLVLFVLDLSDFKRARAPPAQPIYYESYYEADRPSESCEHPFLARSCTSTRD